MLWLWCSLLVLPLLGQGQDQCPPPVGKFLSLNGWQYQAGRAIRVKVRKVSGGLVARLRVEDNQFYSSPKCSILEDAGNNRLYSNFGIREEYDPQTFTRGKDCVVYLSRTDFPEREVQMTILLIAEVTPGLSADCSVLVTSRAAFTVEFCRPTDFSEECREKTGRDAGVPEVILGREISVEGGDGGEEVITGGGLGAELTSGGLPDWVTTGFLPILLGSLVLALLATLAGLGCCWCNQLCCFKDEKVFSPTRSFDMDTMDIKRAVQDEMFEKRHSSHHSEEGTELRDLQTISRDGKHLAVVNAEDIQDGLMIIPGNRKLFTVLEEIDPTEVTRLPRRRDADSDRSEGSSQGYSLNVLNLEGESLDASFKSRYSRHSYDKQWDVGARNNSSGQTTQRGVQTSAEKQTRIIQTDLDHTRTPHMRLKDVGETSVSLASSLNSSTVSVMSDTGAEDTDLLPIRGTKASIARKKAIAKDNKDNKHVHCHYPKKPSR